MKICSFISAIRKLVEQAETKMGKQANATSHLFMSITI